MSKSWRVGWAAVLSLAASAAGAAPDTSAAALAPTAQSLFAEGRLAAAEAALRTQGPEAGAGLTGCRIALLANRLEPARLCYARLHAADPTDRKVSSELATTLARSDRTEAAAAIYDALGQTGRAAEWRAAAHPYQIKMDARSVVIPFVRTDPLPVVRARLNGGPERYFLIDTGAAETVLDPAAAVEAGVKVVGEGHGVFAGDKGATLRFGVLERLTLGGPTGEVEVGQAPVMLLPTAAYSGVAGGLEISGVIGTGLLTRFRATLDYPAGRLVLESPRARLRFAQGATTARLWWAGDHYLLAEGEMEGRHELMLLDTGLAGLACTAPASTLAETGLAAAGPETTGVGGGGAVTARGFEARLTLAGVTQEHAACVSGPFPKSLETSLGPRVGVLVSHGFLRNYATTLDMGHMRLILTPAPPVGSAR